MMDLSVGELIRRLLAVLIVGMLVLIIVGIPVACAIVAFKCLYDHNTLAFIGFLISSIFTTLFAVRELR